MRGSAPEAAHAQLGGLLAGRTDDELPAQAPETPGAAAVADYTVDQGCDRANGRATAPALAGEALRGHMGGEHGVQAAETRAFRAAPAGDRGYALAASRAELALVDYTIRDAHCAPNVSAQRCLGCAAPSAAGEVLLHADRTARAVPPASARRWATRASRPGGGAGSAPASPV